jgi:hypothetical protein
LDDISGNSPVAEQHRDFLPDLGVDQALIGNVPIHKDIGRIEELGDRSARHHRLADMRETCRNYSGDWRNDPALAEMALHLIEAAPKLFDKFILITARNLILRKATREQQPGVVNQVSVTLVLRVFDRERQVQHAGHVLVSLYRCAHRPELA